MLLRARGSVCHTRSPMGHGFTGLTRRRNYIVLARDSVGGRAWPVRARRRDCEFKQTHSNLSNERCKGGCCLHQEMSPGVRFHVGGGTGPTSVSRHVCMLSPVSTQRLTSWRLTTLGSLGPGKLLLASIGRHLQGRRVGNSSPSRETS
jgi:hypothetical protein